MHKYMLVEFAIGVAQIAAAITIGGWYWWLMGILILLDFLGCLSEYCFSTNGEAEQPEIKPINLRDLLEHFDKINWGVLSDDELEKELSKYLKGE